MSRANHRPETDPKQARPALRLETLEDRSVPSSTLPLATATLTNGTLTVNGGAADNRVDIFRENMDIVVRDCGTIVGRFAAVNVNRILVEGGDGNDVLKVSRQISIDATINGGKGNDRIAGSGAVNEIDGGDGRNVLKGGVGQNRFKTRDGRNNLYQVNPSDPANVLNEQTRELRSTALAANFGVLGQEQLTLTTQEVDVLLQRAAAASGSNDAIIAITDRNGRILGVRVESGVAPEIQNHNDLLVFAIDGALAKARTGAFFGNNQAPLTSRTIQNISQSTITQREIESNPNIPDINSTDRGPGFVAPLGIKAHFPPGIAFTPQVDLFQIEHTNRDGRTHPGADRVRGTADDVVLTQRFDLEDAYVPDGQDLFPPDSYGVQSGRLMRAQSRGIGTLPGGIPILKKGQVVGGIGVFFPGKTGFATEENSSLNSNYDPTKPDRSLEAEYIAFATLGGDSDNFKSGPLLPDTITPLSDIVGALDRSKLNSIYLVGIFLEIFGPGGEGPKRLREIGAAISRGNPNDGTNVPVLPDGTTLLAGRRVPEGFLVTPHDGDGITAAEVEDIINRGIQQAFDTRAAIRLTLTGNKFSLGTRTAMVFAVSDKSGKIVGLYRMADATIFSIDVAVAKARNVGYYADSESLQEIDRIEGVEPGVAFTNRSFRYLGEPRYPLGIDGEPPAPFSQLLDGGADPLTGLQVGPRLRASDYKSVVGFDAFNPGTNFRDPNNITRQNGIVFFPGSAPLYKNGRLIGGFGVSGDGVDQDDVVTDAGQRNFGVPLTIKRVDQIFIRGVRVPYQKSLRNPEG